VHEVCLRNYALVDVLAEIFISFLVSEGVKEYFFALIFFISVEEGCLIFNSFKPLNLSNPASDLVRQYDFPVLLRCRKMSNTVFVAFVCPLSEPVRRFFLYSTNFSQHIAQVVFFLYLHVFLF
jgi:hypothetical protein